MLVVLGSINMDIVAAMERAPLAGETLFADSLNTYPGGKGANQAVAAAKLGAAVRFWGMVGSDRAGESMLSSLSGVGVDVSAVESTYTAATGTAIIIVEGSGQNRIVVVRGANFALDTDYLSRHVDELSPGDLLLCQNEIPQPVIKAAFIKAREAGAVTLLNPAPAVELPPDMLELCDFITPNQTEAEALTGISCHSPQGAALAGKKLLEMGAGAVVVTLGEMGVYVCSSSVDKLLAAHRVPVVDTTAAGDSFMGGLCAGIISGLDIISAANLGQLAAAYSVGRRGAQPSMANLGELRCFAADMGHMLQI